MLNYACMLLDLLAAATPMRTSTCSPTRARLASMSNQYVEGHLGRELHPKIDGPEEWLALPENASANEIAKAGEEGCCICRYYEKGDKLLKLSCKCAALFHPECFSSYLTSRDDSGRRPRPNCPHCRQEIRHVTKTPTGNLTHISAIVQRLRDHPEDGRGWGEHDVYSIQMTPARAEYGVDGTRSARAGENHAIRTLDGIIITVRYSIVGASAPGDGPAALSGVRGREGSIPCRSCSAEDIPSAMRG